MFENTNLPRVVRVKSTTPVTDSLEAFDMMSRFLAFEKAKQLSHDFAGQAYLASSSQIWSDLRLVCNSLLEKNDPRRDPVAPWKVQQEQVEETMTTPMSIKTETTNDDSSTPDEELSESGIVKKDKSEKRSAKKAKKEAKKMKKAAKKAAKKERKEKKKRHKMEDA